MVGIEVLDGATLIHEGKHSLVYVGNIPAYGGKVVLKLQKEESNKEIALQFENEFIAVNQFSSYKIRPALGRLDVNHQSALVLKYVEGLSLGEYLHQHQPSLSEKLIIAVSLCQLLDEVHQQGLLHGNFCSDNVLIHPTILSATLIDFKLATTVPKAVDEADLPSGLCLPYLAPEQTGKVSGAVDERADLYSLGVVLYELFAEVLPFVADSPQALVHAHLAVDPVPMDQLQAAIPQVLTELVHKLLAKSPELRYQSATGVQADLEQCIALLEQKGNIPLFPLGIFDSAPHLRIPSSLFGRDKELKEAHKIWQQVAEGSTKLLWISGPAGIGKTTFAEQIHAWVKQTNGYVAKGKFDLLSGNKPYDGLIHALNGLIEVWLTKDETHIIYWRDRIQEAIGRDGMLLTALVPRLKLIIGKQPPLAQLDGPEAQHRFLYIFKSFLKVLAAEEHPLVVQLDDLQWADTATLALLQEIIDDAEFTHFLFIGIYREEEAQANPQLLSLLHSHDSALAPHELTLKNLNQQEVASFLEATFQQKGESVGRLAEVLYTKTKGNPLFLTQFLRSAFQMGLLRNEPKKGNIDGGSWSWQLEKIAQQPQTDNVLSLIISRFQQLDAETQLLLQTAACIGNNFDRNILLELTATTIKYPLSVLSKAVQEGYVVKMEGQSNTQIPSYRFLHDRLLQAVRSTVEEKTKTVLHLRIGLILKNRLQAQESGEGLFDAVTHLSWALPLLDKEAHEALIRLKLQAGKRAMASAGYEASLSYLQEAITLLPPDSWQTNYSFSLELYSAAAQAAYLKGDFEVMDDYIQQVVQHAQQVLDKVRVLDIKVQAQIARNQGAAAVQTALETLGQLGVKLPHKPSKAAILASLIKTELMLRRKGMHKLASMPAMTDPKTLAAMQIMSSVGAAVSRSAPMLFPLLVCKLVQLSLKKGNTLASIPAYSGYGVLQTALFNKVQKGYSYGTLALDLLQRFNAQAVAAKTYIVQAAFLDFWVHPLRNSIEIAKQVYELGLKNGDLEFTASGLMVQCTHGFLAGEPLHQLSERMERYCQQILQLKQELLYQQTRMFHQVVLNLMQEGKLSIELKGEVFDEAKAITEEFAQSSKTGVYYVYLNKLILAYLAGEYSQAQACNHYLADKGDHVMGTAIYPAYVFYGGLLQAAIYDSLALDQQKKAMSQLEKACKSLKGWARHAPMNFRHKYELLQAEIYRIKGKEQQARMQYESAAQGAHEQGYLQDKALAYELAGRYLQGYGKKESANLYLLKAYKAYLQWGANAKAHQIAKQYPRLLQTGLTAVDSAAANLNTKALNVESLLRAATALSSQMKLDKMLENLLMIILQQAGAQEAYVILNKDEHLEVSAKGKAGSPGIELLADVALEDYPEIPSSIINLTVRTQEEVVLSDAQEDKRFSSDPTVAIRYIRSVLSFPVIRQKRVIGILYMHNTLSTGAFSLTQLQVLRLLSGQIAVALENALLYTQMEQRVNERTRELKVQQQILEDKNNELHLLNEEKDELVNIVAHDLRSPLNQIRGLLNLIKLSPENLTPDQQQFVDLSLKSSERLSSMIGRILDTNALESQEIALSLEMVDLDILLEEVVTNFKVQAADKDIELHLILPEDPIEIELDRNYAIQVLDNLLSNALKFSPSGTQVEVVLYEDGDVARIEIKDEGPGISRKDQKRLFSRFQTLTARPTAGEASTGLGLSIAKRYVEAMGGRIGCDSEIGEGSVFFVEFVLV